MKRIENCSIEHTTLGYEGHRILTFYIGLRGDGWGVSFGGLRSDGPGLAECIKKLLWVFEADSWEGLSGKLIRAEWEGAGTVCQRVGHIMKDRWVSIDELAELIRGGAK